MTKMLTTRSLLLAGALAFAALPVLAQTAPASPPAAPVAGTTVTASPSTGKSTTDTTKSVSDTTKSSTHGKKIAHAKSKIHTVSAKKPLDSKVQKPAAGTTSGTGTADPTKKP